MNTNDLNPDQKLRRLYLGRKRDKAIIGFVVQDRIVVDILDSSKDMYQFIQGRLPVSLPWKKDPNDVTEFVDLNGDFDPLGKG